MISFAFINTSVKLQFKLISANFFLPMMSSSELYNTIYSVVQLQTFSFIIHFSAIIHRITIVQNWIIRIICSCFFFVRLILIGLEIKPFVCLLKIDTSPTVFIIEWWDKLHSGEKETLYKMSLELFHFIIFFKFYVFKKNWC